MNWTVDYYRTERGDKPVKVFIDSLPEKLRAKNMREISMLEEFGTNMPAPYVKQMHGKDNDGLWELRVKLSSDITRIFYFTRKETESFCCTDSSKRRRTRRPLN